MTPHQQKQIEIIDRIEQQVENQTADFHTVTPVDDFENDTRICLSSVHITADYLNKQIQEELIRPLQEIASEHYYYPTDTLHISVKNIQVVNDPPTFNDDDIEKVREVFSHVIPKHKKFGNYYYRLLLFPNNLALVGTTDSERDEIFNDLDENLKRAGVPDNKIYANTTHIFSNITFMRFSKPLSDSLKDKIRELSESIQFDPYFADTVSLVVCNAVFKKLRIIDTWKLQ